MAGKRGFTEEDESNTRLGKWWTEEPGWIMRDSFPANTRNVHLLDAVAANDIPFFQSLSPDQLSTALSIRVTYMDSILHYAARRGLVELVRLFAEQSPVIIVNEPCLDGYTPIHICAGLGLLHLAEELIHLGADVSLKTNRRGYTSLHVAAHKRRLKVAQLLIEHGADVNARDRAISTPLHRAAGVGNSLEICEYLLREGAELDAVDKADQTPLTHAVICNQKEVALFLIRHGADMGLKKEYIVLDRYPADFLDDPSLSIKARDPETRKQSGIQIESYRVRLSGCSVTMNRKFHACTFDGTTPDDENVASPEENDQD